MNNVFRVEVGVLMTDKTDKDYAFYAKVYDHQYGYYDEDQYYVQDESKAIADVKQYVASGVDGTYGIVAQTTLDGSCFENGKMKEDINVEGESYDIASVVFSIAKINGKIVQHFVKRS